MKKIILPAIGLTATLAAGSAAAGVSTAGNGAGLRNNDCTVTESFSPACAKMIERIGRELDARQRLAQNFHDKNPFSKGGSFAKGPTFGKAGGGPFVNFQSQKKKASTPGRCRFGVQPIQAGLTAA
jgi:hypothetical protein